VTDSNRPHCRTPKACIAKTAGKHCPPCSLAAKWRDPEFREKRAKAFSDRLQNDPEFRAAHCGRGASHLASWRADPANKPGANERSRANLAKANTPEGIAERTDKVRELRFAGIPRHRWDDYSVLARRMPAADARRIILDDEQVQARRAIERRLLTARDRAERQKAQAY